jgi:hypothetical protein
MTASLHAAEERKSYRVAARSKGSPAVSVVLVSDGSWLAMEQSLACVATHCRRMMAEVIAIGGGDEAAPAALQLAYPEVRFCTAPAGTSESQLRTIAMLEASGDIVALRRSADVSDALWLDAHFRVATGQEFDQFSELETLDMDRIEDLTTVLDEVTAESARRIVRHPIETTSASGASSAA